MGRLSFWLRNPCPPHRDPSTTAPAWREDGRGSVYSSPAAQESSSALQVPVAQLSWDYSCRLGWFGCVLYCQVRNLFSIGCRTCIFPTLVPSLAQFDIWSDVFGQKTQAQCGRVIQMHRLRKFPNVQYLCKDVKGDVHAHLHRLRPKWKTLTTSLKAWPWTQEWWSCSTMFSFTHLRSVVNWELNCGAHWKKDRRGKKLPRVCRIC